MTVAGAERCGPPTTKDSAGVRCQGEGPATYKFTGWEPRPYTCVLHRDHREIWHYAYWIDDQRVVHWFRWR